jgi:mannosyltransferase
MKRYKRTSLRLYIYQSIMLLGLLLAAGLRFYHLDAQSFWNDEGNTARLVERSISLVLSGAAGDVHPPGYYVLLWLWRVFTGETEFALRSFSVLCGIITVALVAATARTVTRGWEKAYPVMVLPALFFVVLHPLSVYYSQEARMYAQLGLATAALLYAAVRFHAMTAGSATVVSGNKRTADFIFLAGTVVFGLYTHYAFIFALFSLGCAYGLYWLLVSARNLRVLLIWLAAFLLGGLLFLPWAPVALRASGWRPPDLGAAHAMLSLGRALVAGVTLPEQECTYLVPVLASLVVLILYKLPRSPFAAWASFAMAFFPALLVAGLGAYRPAYLKFMIVSIAPLAVCLAVVLSMWVPVTIRKVWIVALVAGLTLIYVPVQINSLRHLYSDPAFARDDYRGIASFIESEAGPNDAVVLNAPNQWEVFTYYFRRNLPVYTVPYRPPVQDVPGWVANVVSKHSQLFVLYWGEGEADPQRLFERELAIQAFKASEIWVSSVRLARYGTVLNSLPAQDFAGAGFGPSIQLVAYYLPDMSFSPGDILPITLVWSAKAVPSGRYKIFVHLVSDIGSLIAQTDAEPVGGFHLTNQWLAGEEIRDNYGVWLPASILPGYYTVVVGMYDFSGQRLLVTQQGQVVGDSLRLHQVSVQPRQ